MKRKIVMAGVVGLVLAGCPNWRVVHPVLECPVEGQSTCLDCPDSPACGDGGQGGVGGGLIGDGGGQGGAGGGLTGDGGGTGGGVVGSPTNIIFVTWGTYLVGTLGDGDGGVPVADAVCNADAKLRGYPGHYIALLSTSKVDAKDRIPPGVRGWSLPPGWSPDGNVLDAYGRRFADSRVLDVFGEPWLFGHVSGNESATGSNDWGSFKGPACDDWTSSSASSTYRVGNPARWFPGWLDYDVRSCDVPAALYCMQIDHHTPLPRAVSPDVPRAFVTLGLYAPGRGLAGFDADCAAEAARAGLSGTFQAYVATETTRALTRFMQVPGAYHRLDGVNVNGSGYLGGAPLQVTADMRMLVADGGSWPSSPLLVPTDMAMWTGADDELVAGTQSTCTDWFSRMGTGYVRDAADIAWGRTGRSCSEAAHLACVEVR